MVSCCKKAKTCFIPVDKMKETINIHFLDNDGNANKTTMRPHLKPLNECNQQDNVLSVIFYARASSRIARD